ncbi:hypothetical protein UPYG_G00331970 [Umbra pygmaea]|uniref:Fucolectin tachylectin-4 pentraxin-1 domain-containing protein n=1 Tax=Umbra pygmaea TaxID=75934 RepID=A0ABD0VVL0_UMBPY
MFTALGKKLLRSLFVHVLGFLSLPEGRMVNMECPACEVSHLMFVVRVKRWLEYIPLRCTVISHIPGGETHYFQCNEMEGRYVVVVIPGSAKILTLCEVEVYGSRSVNLALKGVAVQSSLQGSYIASHAIDGNRQTFHLHCTQTEEETNPWWRVDLRNVYRVRSVSITNREDCCPERLDGAEIRIGNSLENNGVMNPR